MDAVEPHRRHRIALAGIAVAAAVAAGTAKGSVPRCTGANLNVRPTLYGEAGGQFIQTFVVTSAGSSACRLAGWPSLARSIRVIQQQPASHPFRTVVVRPGRPASFDVFGADWNAMANRACPKTHTLLVALPGVAARSIAVALPDCGPFDVSPVVGGASDRNAWSTVWAKRWCTIRQFAVTVGPRISEATGQHTLALRLLNRGSSCTLYGLPALWFEDAHGRVPFAIRTGGDMMIRATYALPVVVRRGRSAWVVIDHYRCDGADERAASFIRIGLKPADEANSVRVAVPDPVEHLAYCGKGDPGSTITVAPFEPTLAAAFHR
jgi:hypothetical protein